MEFTLLWAALTAVALGWLALRLAPGRSAGDADRLMGAAAAGLLAGRLGAMILAGVNPLTHPLDIIIVRAGVDTRVAAAAALATLILSTRDATIIDRLAPVALAALAGWHGGCLWRGTCLGTASNLPWAMAQPGSAVTRHPVEIYAALGLAIGAWVVSRLSATPWLKTGAALAIAGGVRLITQPMRPSLSGGPVGWYLAALVIGLTLAGWSQLHGHPTPDPRLDEDGAPARLDDPAGDGQPQP
jgi:hypothetical protein